ncbi:YbeD family protein [Marinomonas algicola]|jgi:uncharacterized protein|uniref:YbeD family protein n=1 Tax=Marinomonas algicola TaxID=2773454 RepID=UPI00174B88DD|nr:DUF493 domain-containing protein [Marinomonas algicola]
MALVTKNGDLAENKSTDAPKIVFPCENYMIKVVALEDALIFSSVLEEIKKHAPLVDEKNVGSNQSSKGKFISFTFRILATSEAQLAALHKDLMSIPNVKMVM